LPNAETIVEAAKIVLPSFPYEEIEGYVAINRPNKSFIDHDMIKDDFPDLSDAEIETNQNIIDDYYSENLDYMVLAEIAGNPTVYDGIGTTQRLQAKTSSEFYNYTCTILRTMLEGYGFVRGTISYTLAGKNATESAENHYPSIDSYDTREDAYRHMLWNSMLAQYYFTISSKVPRLGFAKLVADSRENYCSPGNAVDGKEMDFHNNAIGRSIWSEKTSYIKVFGITVGLYLPSMSLLKTVIFNEVERNSLYIVKDHVVLIYQYSEVEARSLILQAGVGVPVYIKRDMAPVTYVGRNELEYYDCDDFGDEIIPIRINNDTELYSKMPDENEGKCSRQVTVYTAVYPSYISKDINYNPY
jgi:hypothetical protein